MQSIYCYANLSRIFEDSPGGTLENVGGQKAITKRLGCSQKGAIQYPEQIFVDGKFFGQHEASKRNRRSFASLDIQSGTVLERNVSREKYR